MVQTKHNHTQVVVVVVRFVAYAVMLICPLIFVINGDPVPPAPANATTVAADFTDIKDAAPVLTVRYGLFDSNGTGQNNGTKPWTTSAFWFNFEGISSVYGTAIFTFMIHHSIPGLVSPIRPEKHGRNVVGITMLIVAVM